MNMQGEVIVDENQTIYEGVADCRFGTSCYNERCKYLHPEGWNPIGNKKECHYGVHCTNYRCTFSHPKEWNPPKTRNSKCKFGMKCFNEGCKFHHPRGWNPKNNQKEEVIQ